MKVSVFVEASEDGFIAGENNDLSAFANAHKTLVPAGEDFGHGDFIKTVDVVVMGRKTWDTVRTISQWWYADLPVFVLSRTPNHVILPSDMNEHVTQGQVQPLCGVFSPQAVVDLLSARGFHHCYLDGGAETIESFLNDGFVNDITVVTAPVRLQGGISFLQSDTFRRKFKQVYQERHPRSGYVKTKYSRC